MKARSEAKALIRAVEPRDAAAVANLCGELGYQRSEDAIYRWITEAAADGSKLAAFVACIEGRVLGWIELSIVCHLQSEPHVLIGGLVVTEQARGLGIGKLLCEQAASWGRQQRVAVVRVTSRSTRDGAHRFYRGLGYSDVKTSLVFEKNID